jgi:shikimate kinase
MINTPPIFLIGYRGTGKTTTARLLAEALGLPWIDADVLLEERHGRSVRQIFADEGEAGFRDKEAALLKELADRHGHVIATGGGVVLRPENRALLRRGTVVWLAAPPDVLWQRLQSDATTAERRPDLARGGLAEIEELLRVRTPLYAACADWQVDTSSCAPEEAARLILDWLRERPTPA